MRSNFALATASLATLAFLAVPARGDTADTLERTFSVSPGGSLRVEVDFGAVEVTGGAGNEVTLEAQRSVRGRSAEAERKYLAERPMLARRDGDRITVTARRTGMGFWNPGMKLKEARFQLRVPARFDVQIDAAGGHIFVSDLTGAVTAHTSGGSIHATLPQPVPGPVRLETSGGGVTLKVASASAFELDAATSGGNCRSEIRLSRQTSNPKEADSFRGVFGTGGPRVFLRSSGGGIHVVPADQIP